MSVHEVAAAVCRWDHGLSTPEQFFTGSPGGLALYRAVADVDAPHRVAGPKQIDAEVCGWLAAACENAR